MFARPIVRRLAAPALAFSLACPLACAGCSGGSDAATAASFVDGSAPWVTTTTDSGRFTIEVRTSPQPPARGQMTVRLTVRDATTGATQPGLTVTMVPWMPAMGHGTSITPAVTESEPGVYQVSPVDLFMPGTWELRTSLSVGSATDHATPSLQIQ